MLASDWFESDCESFQMIAKLVDGRIKPIPTRQNLEVLKHHYRAAMPIHVHRKQFKAERLMFLKLKVRLLSPLDNLFKAFLVYRLRLKTRNFRQRSKQQRDSFA